MPRAQMRKRLHVQSCLELEIKSSAASCEELSEDQCHTCTTLRSTRHTHAVSQSVECSFSFSRAPLETSANFLVPVERWCVHGDRWTAIRHLKNYLRHLGEQSVLQLVRADQKLIT